VTSIGDSAFAGCSNLKSVTVYWETPLPLAEADSVFSKVDLSKAWLYVPIGKKGAYKDSTVWMDFDSIIEWRGGTVGPLSWGIDGDSTLTISGYGAIPNYDTTALAPWHEFPDDIIKIVIDSGVTGVGTNAFYGCALLDSITIPATVTSLGDSVFIGCQNLVSIDVDSTNTAYSSEDGILFNKQKTVIHTYPAGKPETRYNLPATVASIGSLAFAGCSSLDSIAIPSLVTSLGRYAFANCTGLTDVAVSWNEPLDIEADSVFSGVDLSVATLHVPIGTRALYAAAPVWADFGMIEEITSGTTGSLLWSLSGDTLTISGAGAMPDYTLASPAPWYSFRDSVKTVVIELGVTGIGSYAFYGSDSITSIALSDSVKIIGSLAFAGCHRLDSIAIPDWVTSIGDSVFAGCRNLVSIATGAANTAYSSVNDILFDKEKTSILVYPAGKPEREYSIPITVRTVGKAAFAGCDSLRSVLLPDSLTSIGYAAFAGCSRLDSIAIPD
jgi:hypothetical protein